MILKITLALFVLVAINFTLLFLSVNKKAKSKKDNVKPIIIKKNLASVEQPNIKLAPTGS